MITAEEEYCLFETLHAQCPKEEVIMITHARYGRMKAGKCIEEGLGTYVCMQLNKYVVDIMVL